jgi:hypothetical protein
MTKKKRYAHVVSDKKKCSRTYNKKYCLNKINLIINGVEESKGSEECDHKLIKTRS